METRRKFYRSMLTVAGVTAVVLLVPFVAMQFTAEVRWTAGDFVIMGALLIGIGTSYVLATRRAPNVLYRIAMGLGLAATLFMIWANLAVGLIGSGPHAGNLMYIAVVAVGVIGTLRSRLHAKGMEAVMYGMALTLVFLTGIALLTGMDRYPGSSMVEIIGVNAFLATPFVIAGLLFRHAGRQHAPVGG